MRPTRSSATLLTALLTAGTITACGTESNSPPAAVGASAGDNQTATAGGTVPIAPAVSVTDAGGAGVGGVTVTFAVASGGGSVTGGTATSDGQGIATVGSWILGSLVGSNTLTATVSGLAPATFTATGIAGSPASITAAAGDGQTAANSTALPVQPAVAVQDANGNPVVGVAVTFAVTAGGGSVTSPATTDANGEAVTDWTLGSLVGTQTMEASVAGTATASAFSATAVLGPPVGVSITGTNQSSAIGTPVPAPITVTVVDAGFNPIPGIDVIFSVASGGGSITGANQTTDANGVVTLGSWTLGTTVGMQSLNAAVTGLATPRTITATATAGPPAMLAIQSGDGQTWAVGSASPNRPTVRVTDAFGNVVPGASVTFTAGAGSGSVTGSPATTDINGDASVAWSLGQTGSNTLDASAAGTNSVTFSATGVTTNYTMALQFSGSTTGLDLQAFADAAFTWMNIITADLPDVDYAASPISANACGINHGAIDFVVDDILLLVEAINIDGPGGALAGATWCDNNRAGGLPSVGIMQFDIADLGFPVFQDVIEHEMGHAIGIGTLWGGFLVNPSLPNSSGVDTHFTGPQAIIEFDNAGGAGRTIGMKVPVENSLGGAGTRDAHWRESTFANELMTGFVSLSSNPLSTVTIASLADLGYAVDLNQAEAYTIANPNALRLAGEALIPLGNDILIVPGRVDHRRRNRR